MPATPPLVCALAVAGAWACITPARAATLDTPPAPVPRPPRVDGMYLGVLTFGSLGFARVRDLETPAPFGGPGGGVRIGQAVFPWMTIGIELLGSLAFSQHEGASQRLGQGGLLVELGFLPIPKVPFSVRAGFGFAGGAVRQQDVAGRSGFGGAAFRGAVRYEFFPFADRRRPDRGGGFVIGPELGWLGATPAAAGRPMANTIYLGLWTGFYFGD